MSETIKDIRYSHADEDGDRIDVRAGMLGAVIDTRSGYAEEQVEVAIRYEYLPGLIAALQDILAESDHGVGL